MSQGLLPVVQMLVARLFVGIGREERQFVAKLGRRLRGERP